LTWIDREGKLLGGPDVVEGGYADFRLAPDEKSLAASLFDPKTGAVEIWLTDLARNSRLRFSSGGPLTGAPLWSRDGRRLVFRSSRNGLVEVFQRSASGGGEDEIVFSAEAYRAARLASGSLVLTDWSPDGRNLIFSVPSPATGTDLWLLPFAKDSQPVPLIASAGEQMHGNFSPAGDLIAYTSNESGRFGVYVETFPRSDRKWPVSTNGGYEPRWRADGREIYYLSEDRKLMAVPVGPGPTFGIPKPLFQTRVPAGVAANHTHYVPSRDGQRFLVNTQTNDPSPSPITVVVNWTSTLGKK
jgi:Tol biopolymer transport system component